jgi:hypothetical protein
VNPQAHRDHVKRTNPEPEPITQDHVEELLPEYLNDTIDPPSANRVREHLALCAACRLERDAWQAIRAATRASVSARLTPGPHLLDGVWGQIDRTVTSPLPAPGESRSESERRQSAFSVNAHSDQELWTERTSIMRQPERKLNRTWLLRPLVGVAAAAALAAAIVATPVGSYAQGFLTIFTPKQFVAVPVTQAEMQSLPDLNSYGTFTNSAHQKPQHVTSATAASAASGLHVLVPGTMPPGAPTNVSYEVIPGQSASFTFSAAKAKAAAAAQGKTIPPMPANIDGSSVQVSAGAAVLATYTNGNLNQSVALSEKSGKPSVNELANQDMQLLLVGQSTAPVVTSTGVSAAELEQYLLAQPGISPDLTAAIKAIGDPTSALPIPVPVNKASAHPISVQGVQGLAVADSTGLGGGLVWEKNGTIYGVAGTYTEAELLAVANSLH